MPVQIGSKGQADFSEPIELLMDCHRRIEHFLGVLDRVLQGQSPSKTLEAQNREALEAALNYFKYAAPRHTADEEESLFPRMRQTKSQQVQEVMAHVDRLEADHRKAEKGHEVIEKIGRQWLKEGQLAESDLQVFTTTLHDMMAIYREHIPLEDKQVFIVAAGVLDAQSLDAVGQEMKKRRQEDHGRPGSTCSKRRAKQLGQAGE